MHKYVNWDAPCIFFSASKNNLKRLVSQQNQSIKLSSNAKVNAGLEPSVHEWRNCHLQRVSSSNNNNNKSFSNSSAHILWPGTLNTKEQSYTDSENFPMRLNTNLHSAKTFDYRH